MNHLMMNTTNDIPLTVEADQFQPVRVEERVWYSRMQDEGCEKSKLPKKTYLQSTIPPIGPKDSPLFYYDLSSIAIDLLKKMWYEKEMGRGWAKLPKNKTDIKVKIIKGLLALRKRTDSGQYTLSQTKILEMLSNQWGAGSPSTELHHNDRVRVFGILMTIPENREYFQRLAEGVTSRRHIDDPEFSLKQIYQSLAFTFNNESIKIVMPSESFDLDKISEIDPNDVTRIRIRRDWMWVKHVYDTTQVLYKGVLKNWFKGTGGGTGLTTMLESWNNEKLTKYDVDVETYDHTNIENRPSILLDLYCTQRTPYLTVIYLMDKATDYLLSSRHDPLRCGRGEPGMDESDISIVTSASKPPKKGSAKITGLDDMIKSVVDYCTKGEDNATTTKSDKV